MEITSRRFGVSIKPPRFESPYASIQLLNEHAGFWSGIGNSFPSCQIDELISVLQETKRILRVELEANLLTPAH